MIPLPSFRKAVLAGLVVCTALTASATGLINSEAASVVHARIGASRSARGRQLATLQSYLLAQPVTVGLDPADDEGGRTDCIMRGIQIWTDSIPDCPFVLAKKGEHPMVVVKFVNSIESGGDVQGQVQATREIHWGSSIGYHLDGTLLVRQNVEHRSLNCDEMTEVVAHELGHLLGLDDAEGCVGLMGPFLPGHPRLKPSQAEIDAVNAYRQDLRDALAKLGSK